ncbi:sigma-70 family RNA polymerase sigma factor [Candidatus Margulisiibacteriota bacterium]
MARKLTPNEKKQWKRVEKEVVPLIKSYLIQNHTDKIFKKFQEKINGLVYNYLRRLPPHVSGSERDDLANVARIEFLETLKVWDPEQNEDPWPLAYSKINGAMRDHIRYLTKADPTRFLDWVSTAGNLFAAIEQHNAFADQVVEKVNISEAMKVLDERERIIIHERYKNDLTFDEIGKKIDVSESQVTRIYKGALEKLRDVLHVSEIGEEPPTIG